jgi:hypothetical protein
MHTSESTICCHHSIGTMRNILLAVLVVAVANTPVEAFSAVSSVLSTTPCNRVPSRHVRGKPDTRQTCFFASTYGRGAEIWPPGNDAPIRLEASFPNGVLPDLVVDRMSGLTNVAGLRTAEEGTAAVTGSFPEIHNKPLRRTYVPRAIGRILRRAAYAQEETESEATASPMDRTPMVLAAGLVFSRMIRPLDALIMSFLTGYFIVLFLAARSVRRDGTTPVMPSLPPQGHVPNLVTNPLGPCFTTYSMNYDYWLKTGVLLGLVAPVAMMLRYAATNRWDCARVCARPIFFICCQTVSEAVARRSLVRSSSVCCCPRVQIERVVSINARSCGKFLRRLHCPFVY